MPNLQHLQREAASAANGPVGLTQAEAARRLRRDGPNTVSATRGNALTEIAGKFWAPVPWLLEAAVVLQLVLGEFVQAAIVFGLLIFNAALGFVQSSNAEATLNALKSRLALNASILRDGRWATAPAAGLVRGDVIKLVLGGIVAADARIVDGEILLDQSMLTGESVPVEAGIGFEASAGALIRRGEAVAEVTATGARTKFGRTAELVKAAHSESTQQIAVFGVVKALAVFNAAVIAGLLFYSLALRLSAVEIVSLLLTALLSSIPVALPATFTLAAAVGARVLAAAGILPTRLTAVDDAASMDVLCCDKTGTLTLNELSVTAVRAAHGFDSAHVLGLAALASSDAGQDPVDTAIRRAAAAGPGRGLPELVAFQPFDPKTKMSGANVSSGGSMLRVVKGAFTAVSAISLPDAGFTAGANELEGQGFRVLAVTFGPPQALELAGLIALSDLPRPDAAPSIAQLAQLGIRTIMVTGDAAMTASIVAKAVGLAGTICPPGPLPETLDPATYAAYAGVLPADKYRLVQAFQRSGHVVGMCGDGANDAAALRQAQMGIAVSTATDIAKSAAGIVLTTAGLAGIIAAVTEGRITFQRILTYTLNSMLKKIAMALFLVVGLVMTGHAVLTPMLLVILMVVGDFIAMSLTTDNVAPSREPNVWRIRNLTVAGITLAICQLGLSSAVFSTGVYILHLPIGALQTLAFITVAFGGQASTYAIRERRSLWSLPPSRLLVASSSCDALICATLAIFGLLVTPLPWVLVVSVFAAAIFFGIALDYIKLPLFSRLQIS